MGPLFRQFFRLADLLAVGVLMPSHTLFYIILPGYSSLSRRSKFFFQGHERAGIPAQAGLTFALQSDRMGRIS
jgi:hypothetical protein